MIIKSLKLGQTWWLTPIIWAVWEMEVGRMTIWDQPEQNVCETPSQPIKLDMVALSVILVTQEA
jgi:hypothetical protein